MVACRGGGTPVCNTGQRMAALPAWRMPCEHIAHEHLQQKIHLVQGSVFPQGKGTKKTEVELRDVFTSIGKLFMTYAA